MDSEKKRFDFYLTSDEMEAMNRLVESGLYVSRAEVVRDALRHGFVRHGIPLRLEVPAPSEL